MKRLIAGFALTLLTSSAMAYSINGSSDTKFVLKCNDGTSNTSSMPPNHNTATEWCKDHGGVAAGYPKQIVKTTRIMSVAPAMPTSVGAGGSNNRATDYNSSRSNKSTNNK